MNITPKDLVSDLSGAGGERFESFLHGLLVLEAGRDGRPSDIVAWDHRTTVPDGGRDIVVKEGATSSDSMLGPVPAIWSAKAGADGKKASTLRSELQDHQKVKDWISVGNAYKYAVLQSASQEQRDALERERVSLCEELGVGADKIQIVFNEAICSYVNRCPTLVPCHLPSVSHRLGRGATAVARWRITNREQAPEFITVSDREQVREKVRGVVRGSTGQRYLHIAGWSGIGKTRLVAEALDDDELAARVVVYTTWGDFCDGLRPSMRSGQVTAAIVVIDEVDMSNVPDLASLCATSTGLRIVSIGASDDRPRSPANTIILQRPDEESIAQLVRTFFPLSSAAGTVKRVADLADGDFRCAIRLAEVCRDLQEESPTPSMMIAALSDLSLIIDKYLERHQSSVGPMHDFRSRLAILCVLADVGVRGEAASELRVLAEEFGRTEVELKAAVRDARNIGLCREIADLVECIPRPFATCLFEHYMWDLIGERLLDVVTAMPSERARRSLFRRLEYCGSALRKEADEKLGGMFREQFADAGLDALSDADTVRTLRAVIELAPQEGLQWLRQTIEGAGTSALAEWSSGEYGHGAVYSRRNIVWLCERLKAFGDCFEDAEAILFELAKGETESFSNNSTGVWKQCFRWRLSGTEVPLRERIDILLRRMSEADPAQIDLVLIGAMAALDDAVSAAVPPEFVGGRATPPEWTPRVWGDVFAEWERVIGAVVELSKRADLRETVIESILSNLHLFIKRGVPESLRSVALSPEALSEEETRDLRKAIDAQIHRKRSIDEATRQALRSWGESISPNSLAERIREVVGRDPWDHVQSPDDYDSWKLVYQDLADEVLAAPADLAEVVDWLGTAEARSAFAFGSVLAVKTGSLEGVIGQIVVDQLKQGACREFVAGYFAGLAGAERQAPTFAVEAIEGVQDEQPDLAIRITIDADVNRRGLDRILRLLRISETAAADLVGGLFGAFWNKVLRPKDQRVLIETLLNESESERGVTCALHLVSMWHRGDAPDFDPTLTESIKGLLAKVADGKGVRLVYEWERLARWWVHREPDQGARYLVTVVSCTAQRRLDLIEAAGKILTELAEQRPDAVASAVSEALGNKGTQIAFELCSFRGVFERLGVDRLESLIEAGGTDVAVAIARNLPDPDSEVGSDVVAWFVREFVADDRVFGAYLAGRHSFIVFSGYGFQRKPGVYDRTEPYIESDNPGIRKWAQWERDWIDEDARRDQKLVDQEGRD